MDRTLEQFFNLIRKQLYRRLRPLARPLSQLKDECPSDTEIFRDIRLLCGTDGRSVFWNLRALQAMEPETPGETVSPLQMAEHSAGKEGHSAGTFLLLQVIHCLFGHPFSMPLSCPPKTWSLACDIAAWYILSVWTPELLPPAFRPWLSDLSRLFPGVPLYQARQVAECLIREGSGAKNRLPGLPGSEFSDTHCFWPLFRKTGSFSAGKTGGVSSQSQQGSGNENGAVPILGKNQNSRATPTPPEPSETKTPALWMRLKHQLAKAGSPLSPAPNPPSPKSRGTIGKREGGMTRPLVLTNARRHNYRSLLKSLARWGEEIRLNDEEFPYAPYLYGLEHYNGMPFLEPSECLESRKIRELAIVIDTSASCSHSLTQAFLEETRNLLLEEDLFFRPFNLHILQCDMKVERDDKLTSPEDLKDYIGALELCGMGGTDFRPAFSHIRKLQECREFSELSAILFFTDGLGLFPPEAPGVKTIFIFLKDQEHNAIDLPDWAEILVLDAERMES